MKKLILIPLTLAVIHISAYEGQSYYGNELYAESTPAYTPPKPGQPTSTTYQQQTPSSTSSQSTTKPNYTPSTPNPSYSNSQHPYGAPGSSSSTYQRPGSQAQPRTLPSHPYGPPGSGRMLAEDANNGTSSNNPNNAYSNSNSNSNENEETPYEKYEPTKGQTAAVTHPSVSNEVKSPTDSPLKIDQSQESKDKHKTESDRALNQKIRDQINGGMENSFPGILLITSDGAVIIEGYVPNIESHDKLEKTISKIDGVKSVTNNTTVKSHK